MYPPTSTPKSCKTSNESETDDEGEGGEGGEGVNEQNRDAAVMRIFLSTKLDMLKSRELAYQRQQQAPPVSVGEAHADCLLLTSTDVDCDSLRAAYATGAILAAEINGGGKSRRPDEVEHSLSDEEERQRQRQQLRETTGDLWLDYCRTVTRLYCRIEAAFLRMATPFVTAAGVGSAVVVAAEAGADAGAVAGVDARADARADAEADRQPRARQLWLLADGIAGLATRLGVELTPEFESCRDCIQRFMVERRGKRESEIAESQASSQQPTSKWSTAASTPSPVASSANPPTRDSQQGQQQQQHQEPDVQEVSSRVLLPCKNGRRRLVYLLVFVFLGCVAFLPLGWYLRSLRVFCLDWDLILDRLAWPNGVPY